MWEKARSETTLDPLHLSDPLHSLPQKRVELGPETLSEILARP